MAPGIVINSEHTIVVRGSGPQRGGGQRRGQRGGGRGRGRGRGRGGVQRRESGRALGGEEEETRREAVRQHLRDLSQGEQALELIRLRQGVDNDRRQLLWKEERISILEQAMMADLAPRESRSLELRGDRASELAAPSPAAADPPALEEEEEEL
ncbi:uncharacterized protein GIQ15_03470 [Arthroderma uncinatum]|uniref:uncharacterized protein n=1 Tax=Arthroderma uncinatum TaxID=74035 RepID=UPI00144AC0B1|nr:uncharacterized protein GIQ15_03470 [Arthroderma uncinatum]KAF3484146.1 hypothetical protein GIQ15_03470 [Arthroderma uncinatum]